MAVLRPKKESNSSSVLDETVLFEGSFRSLLPFWLRNFMTWYVIFHRLYYLPIKANVMKLTWFQKPNTALHGGGLYQRNSVTSLTGFSVLSTRREWCARASLLIPHRHFVSKSLMVSGVLYMIIISLVWPLYQHKLPQKGCFSEQHGRMYNVQFTRRGRWLLSTAHASK